MCELVGVVLGVGALCVSWLEWYKVSERCV